MVRNIHVTLDDGDADRVQAVKDDLDLTWREFLLKAAEALEDDEGAETGGQPAEPPTTPTPSQTPPAADSGPTTVDDVDLPGAGANLEGRREALRAMYNLLKEKGSAEKEDFEAVTEEIEHGYKGFESFWSNCIKSHSALSQLAGVQSPGRGGSKWRYVESNDA